MELEQRRGESSVDGSESLLEKVQQQMDKTEQEREIATSRAHDIVGICAQ